MKSKWIQLKGEKRTDEYRREKYEKIRKKGYRRRNSSCINYSLMSKIERKYCLISTSYLAAGYLTLIFILLHILQNCVCFGDLHHLL